MATDTPASPAPPLAASGSGQTQTLILQPRDPLIVRDARPFTNDAGARARTLPWPLPSTIAGALRTHIGNHAASRFDWHDGGPDLARRIVVRGPLLIERNRQERAWTCYLPAPADAVPWQDDSEASPVDRLLWLRPRPAGATGGSNLPHKGLRELVVEGDVKPKHGVVFWSLEDTLRWLRAADPSSFGFPTRWRGTLPQATRVHVGIDPDTLAHRTGALFATTGLAFSDAATLAASDRRETAMLCQVTLPGGVSWQPARAFVPLGGERRVSDLRAPMAEEDSALEWPAPDEEHLKALEGGTQLRLLLVSPAIFAGGWRPGWLDATTLTGTPPPLAASGVSLRLVAAAVGRRVPVSGWDMQHNRPKPTLAAAPAGSVYFFEVAEGTLTRDVLRQLWLAPISDDVTQSTNSRDQPRPEQHRDDGFGLVLPGHWVEGSTGTP